MKCNIKRKRAEEKVDSAYKTIGKTILAFLDASAGCVICDFCGYKAKRLREMYNGTQQVLSSMMEFYGADNDGDRERADMSLFVAKRRLAECGFDFASATESLPASDTFGLTWHPDSEWQKTRTARQTYTGHGAGSADLSRHAPAVVPAEALVREIPPVGSVRPSADGLQPACDRISPVLSGRGYTNP